MAQIESNAQTSDIIFTQDDWTHYNNIPRYSNHNTYKENRDEYENFRKKYCVEFDVLKMPSNFTNWIQLDLSQIEKRSVYDYDCIDTFKSCFPSFVLESSEPTTIIVGNGGGTEGGVVCQIKPGKIFIPFISPNHILMIVPNNSMKIWIENNLKKPMYYSWTNLQWYLYMFYGLYFKNLEFIGKYEGAVLFQRYGLHGFVKSQELNSIDFNDQFVAINKEKWFHFPEICYGEIKQYINDGFFKYCIQNEVELFEPTHK